MDIDQGMDALIKRDKKMGRVRQTANLRGKPLPGRGRGGRINNTERARAQPRVRNNGNGIQKRPNNNNQQQQQRPKQNGPATQNNQNQNNGQNRNRNNKARLMGNQNANNMQVQGAANRRARIQQIRQNNRNRGRRVPLANAAMAQPRNQQPPLRKRQPQMPVVAKKNRDNQQQNVQVVQGTLAQRKIKVRNIDARVVSVADLQKLFGKCGPLINATFDTNEFGSYLGTATVIYMKASSATRAIKDYNMAQIDNRPMKVQYAMMNQPIATQGQNNINNNAPQQRQTAVRKTNNRIQKSGGGRTLNVMGGNRRGARGRGRQ